MRIIIAEVPGRFRGLKRPRRDLMKRAAAFNSPRAAIPSRRRKDVHSQETGLWASEEYVGFDPHARDLI